MDPRMLHSPMHSPASPQEKYRGGHVHTHDGFKANSCVCVASRDVAVGEMGDERHVCC